MDSYYLIDRGDGTYDIVFEFSKYDAEFAADFFKRENLNQFKENLQSILKKQSKNIRINAIKIAAGGLILATLPFAALGRGLAMSNSYVMTYVYSGTVATQTANISRTGDTLNSVSPSYYDINKDGTIKFNAVSASFVNEMHSKGIKVVPFLSNHWDRQAGVNFLKNIDAVATQLANNIISNNLDGINVDIENVTHTERDQYTRLVAALREKLPAGKEVSVAVAANPNGWTTGWHGSYDYAALAKYSDHLFIMTYDESWQGSSAGPVASVNFVENSIKYALKHTTPDKIVIGLPFYGRLWSDSGTFNGNGISLNTAQNMITNYKANVTLDTVSQSPKAEFTVKSGDPSMTVSGKTLAPGKYTLWFENDMSIQKKLNLVSKYNLKGSGSWELGNEPAEIWTNYGAWQLGQSSDAEQSSTVYGYITSQTLNMRSAPRNDANVINTVRAGTRLTILSNEGAWMKVSVNGLSGYVASSYVAVESAAEYGYISSTTLNLRGAANTGASILKVINGGTRVAVHSNDGTWMKITANGLTGYVGSAYVVSENAARTGTVISSQVKIRKGPGTSHEALGDAPKGSKLTVLDETNGWYKVIFNGTIGYSYGSYYTVQ